MTFTSYNLEQEAHDLVLRCFREYPEASREVYKMRTMVTYGLERFWGERFRLEPNKAQYWRETWEKLVEIMSIAGIDIPNGDVGKDETARLRDMAEQLWDFPEEERKIVVAVLTQLCDSLIWWTQRYKNLDLEN